MVQSFSPLIPAVLAVLAAVPAIAGPAAGRTLAALQDRHRVVLVFAPAPDDPQLQEQRAIMAGFARGAAERDLLLVQVAGDRVQGVADGAERPRQHYRIAADRFRVLLIGKDGHVAIDQNQPLTAAHLEQAIDAMPMRQAEMARASVRRR